MKKIIYILLLLWGFNSNAQTVKWAKDFGSSTNDAGSSIAADANGNTYTMGWYTGNISFGSTSLTNQGSNDIYLTKLDSTGTPQWAVNAGGKGDDRGYGITIDASGNLYVCGLYSSTCTFGTGANSVSLTSAGGTDLFVAMYNSSGTLQWAKSAGSTNNERAVRIVLDQSDDIYICGYYNLVGGGNPPSNANATFGNITLNGVGRGDFFAAKINNSGNWKWAVGGGSANFQGESANDLTFDKSGNLYVVGQFSDSVNFGNGYKVSKGGADIFVAVLDQKGNLNSVYTTGSRQNDFANAVTIGIDGRIYVGGAFNQAAANGGNNSIAFGSYTLTPQAQDAFIACFDSNLSVQWATNYGGSQGDAIQKMSASSDGNIYIAGNFNGTASIGSNTLTSLGGNDVFVCAIDTSFNLQWALGVGSAFVDDCRDILATGKGKQYITGSFNGTGTSGTKATFGSQSITAVDQSDIYVAEFSGCPGISSKVTASGPTDFCSGDSVTLTAANGSTSYQWNLNGSPINNDTNISITINAAGTYDVTISNAQGCSQSSVKVTVNVGTPPSASISAPATQFCTGDSIVLTSNAGNGYTYKWYLNGTAQSANYTNSTLYYAKQAGDYTVEVNSFGCKKMSSKVTLTTIQSPTVTIKATGSTTFCLGDSVLLTSDTNSTWTYQWQRNTQSLNNANTDQYYAKLGGSYRMLISTPAGCTVLSNNIVVNAPNGTQAPLQVVYPAGQNYLCKGNTVFLGTQGGGPSTTYQWYDGTIPVPNGTTRFIAITKSGDYKVEVMANGCSNFSKDTVLTFINENAAITPSPTAGFCPNDTVTLNAVSADAGSTYQWEMNGTKISGATNSMLDVTTSGSYLVYIILNKCIDTTTAVAVTPYSAPATPGIVINVNNLACTVTATSYQWYLNGQPIANSNNQFIYGWQTGFYMVEVTDANGCIAKSQLVSFTNNGIETISVEKAQVIPNPNVGSFALSLNCPNSSIIQITDMTGRVVLNQTYNTLNGLTNIDLGTQPEGLYLLSVKSGNKLWREKVQVIR
ncbi:MAG: T9SS type A sorting domain-containing protein [Bacteroidota bacterium]|nr:T9SS type A sorting domain-containing protein [Bacteroidota bacterium]